MKHAIHARWMLLILAGALAGCAAPQRAGNEVRDQINDVLLKSATERRVPHAEVTDKSQPYPTWYEPEGGAYFQRGMSLTGEFRGRIEKWVDHHTDGDRHERNTAAHD